MTKKFNEHDKSKPFQLELFKLEDAKYSRTIELYDSLPKFVAGKVTRISDVYLPSIERKFEFKNRQYRLVISPASVRDKKGNEKYYYPGKREEIVQDALRKLMVDGKGVFLDEAAAVVFTIYNLKQELAAHGHTYSGTQIKESLTILTKASIELYDDDGKQELTFHPIETLGIKGEDGEIQTFAKFSPLVTKSIRDRTFRLFNYKTVMGYSSTIARRLHKRMAHFYVYAKFGNNYHLKLTTMVRDFGLSADNPLSSVLQNVEIALEEMKQSDVVVKYNIKKEYTKVGRKRLLDALIEIYPSVKFANEVVKANAESKQIRELLG